MNSSSLKIRSAAEANFRSLPMPTNQDENYRFSNLKSIPLPEEFSASNDAIVAEKISLEEGESALLTLVAGAAKLAGEIEGFEFQDLASKSAEDQNLWLQHSALSEKFAEDKFAQLAAARWQNGIYLRIPKGKSISLPLRAVQSFAGAHAAFRSLIIVEEGASLRFVEEYAGEAEFVCGLLEIEVHKNARLQYAQVQRFGVHTNFFLRQEFRLEPGAFLEVHPVYLGGASGQVRQETKLLEGAEFVFSGAACGSGSQQYDFWMDVDHQEANTKSGLDFYFVMDGSSKASFNGLIHIRKEGVNAEAYQKSRSLLLSEKAQASAIPKLIIQTDAVKCSHGASVASILPEQVHYLQSRGISKLEAEKMIVRGFTEVVLARLPTEALYARVEQLLAQKETVIQ